MKFFNFHLFLITDVLIYDSCAVVENLSAVVARDFIARSLYSKAKYELLESGSEKKPENLDPDTKNRICLKIMGSSEYTSLRRKPVDKKEISERLIHQYPDVFGKLYEHTDLDYFNDKMVYTNPTFPIEVSGADEEEPPTENVFVCVSRVGDADEDDEPRFWEYLVSEEYNVSDFPGKYVAARFIFHINDDRIANVDGVAEEPATAFLGADWPKNILSLFFPYISQHQDALDTLHLNVERLYLLKRRNSNLVAMHNHDSICKLDEDERFRLCTLVFTSKYFEGKVKLPSSYSMVDDFKCAWNGISFRRHDSRRDAGEKAHKEWMIVCYMSGLPFDYNTEYDKAYYVSFVERGSKNSISSNDVFVYHHGESKSRYELRYYLINVFTNVRLDLY